MREPAAETGDAGNRGYFRIRRNFGNSLYNTRSGLVFPSRFSLHGLNIVMFLTKNVTG